MKVIVSNGGYLPATSYGGPVVSIDNLCSFLHEEIEFFVLCTDHELGSNERLKNISEGWNDRGNCKVQYLSDINVNKKTLDSIIDEINPDTIYINSLFDAMWTLPLLSIAKNRGIKVLLAPRGQLCKNAFIGKYKKLPYIWYLKMFGLIKDVDFQSTSDEETETIKKYLGGVDDNIHFLTNLPSIPSGNITHLEKKPGKGRFVFYSRIVPKKNLISAIGFFDDIKGEVELDIYGPIEDEIYWGECKKNIENLPVNVSVNYKGIIEHENVFEILSQYDAFLFPTLSENFGHVISESLFSGTPVIISDQTPWRGLEEVGAGWDIPLNDKIRFENAIQTVISWNSNQLSRARKVSVEFVKNRFEMDKLKQDYLNALGV